MTGLRVILAFAILAGVAACGGDGVIDQTCDEPQRYQRIVAGKRIEVPEGLDSLDEFAEMPIPKPEGAPERPPGSRCVELPPLVKTGS